MSKTQIQLVCRDRGGKELMRQTCADEAEARRLMIARNRPVGIALDYPAWGIETEVGHAQCTHNSMVPTGETDRAWKCAVCGYVYGGTL